jgi:hypothetical protein
LVDARRGEFPVIGGLVLPEDGSNGTTGACSTISRDRDLGLMMNAGPECTIAPFVAVQLLALHEKAAGKYAAIWHELEVRTGANSTPEYIHCVF